MLMETKSYMRAKDNQLYTVPLGLKHKTTFKTTMALSPELEQDKRRNKLKGLEIIALSLDDRHHGNQQRNDLFASESEDQHDQPLIVEQNECQNDPAALFGQSLPSHLYRIL